MVTASWGCLRADDYLSQVLSFFFGIFLQFKDLLEVMNHILVQALPELCKDRAPRDVALGVQISANTARLLETFWESDLTLVLDILGRRYMGFKVLILSEPNYD